MELETLPNGDSKPASGNSLRGPEKSEEHGDAAKAKSAVLEKQSDGSWFSFWDDEPEDKAQQPAETGGGWFSDWFYDAPHELEERQPLTTTHPHHPYPNQPIDDVGLVEMVNTNLGRLNWGCDTGLSSGGECFCRVPKGWGWGGASAENPARCFHTENGYWGKVICFGKWSSRGLRCSEEMPPSFHYNS
ncbi:unnamed protein product [Amoebophrya sp. A120]|nr:unnamed protein product [Amoebophrya sp. A120]|eukprot:GSA120T00000943001.1